MLLSCPQRTFGPAVTPQPLKREAAGRAEGRTAGRQGLEEMPAYQNLQEDVDVLTR
jgi:hypothetical protein